MSVKSEPLVNGAPAARAKINIGNRVAAAIAWLVGLTATYLGLSALLTNAPVWLPIVAALVAQGMLTWAERAIWHGRPSLVGGMALILDTLLNAGGVFPYALLLGNTPPVQMFAAVLNTPSQIGPVGAMIVSIVLGFAIAAAPEEFWTRKG